jgi:hypothetical protein
MVHIYIYKLQPSITVKLNNHNVMFRHVYHINMYTVR